MTSGGMRMYSCIVLEWSSNNDMASNYRVVIRVCWFLPPLTCTPSSPCILTTLGAVSPVHCKVLPVGRSYLLLMYFIAHGRCPNRNTFSPTHVILFIPYLYLCGSSVKIHVL